MAYQPKSYKKFVATAATATLVASAIAPVAFADSSKFTDVSAKYKDAVDFVVSKGANGLTATQFGVDNNIKRVDAAVLLVNVLGLDIEAAPASGLVDVPQRAVKHINALKAAGITSGKTETTFAPDAQITRGELAIWISKAFKLEGSNTTPFKDVSSNYTTAVSALVAAGITQGTSETTFGTTANAKRGDYAIFLQRAAKETPGELAITGVSALDDSNKYLEITFSQAVKGLETSDITVQNADTLAKYGVKDVKVSSNGKTATVELYSVEDQGVLDYLQDYTVKVFANGQNLEATFNRPAYVKERVSNIDVKEKEFTVGGVKINVPANVEFDYYNALGREARVWYNSDRDLVNVAYSTETVYETAVEVTKARTSDADGEVKFLSDGKKYDLADDFDFYLNDDSKAIGTKGVKYDFAKVVLDKTGDVEKIFAYNFDDSILVDKVDGNIVVDFDENEEDFKDYLIVKDGKQVSISDLKQNDLVFFNEDAEEDGIAIVLNKTVTGKIENVFDDSFEIDGKTYDYENNSGTVQYLNDDEYEELDSKATEKLQAGGNVTVYINWKGDAVLVKGTEGQVDENYATAYTTDAIVAYKDSKGNARIELTVADKDGKEKLYDFAVDSLDEIVVQGANDEYEWEVDEDTPTGTKFEIEEFGLTDFSTSTSSTDKAFKFVAIDENETKSSVVFEISDNASLFGIATDDNGKVTGLKFYEATATTTAELETKDNYAKVGNKSYRVSDSTVVYDVEVETGKKYPDADDVKVKTLGDLRKSGTDIKEGATIYFNEKGDVTHIVTKDLAAAEVTEQTALLKRIDRNTDGEIVRIVALVDGASKTLTVDKVKESGLFEGSVVVLDVNDVDGVVDDINVKNNQIVTGKIASINVSKKEITLVNGGTYALDSNGEVYDATDEDGDDFTVEAIRDLEEGDSIVVALSSAGSRYADAFVMVDAEDLSKYPGAPGQTDTTAPTATVTTATVTVGQNVTAQSNEVGTAYLVSESANLTTKAALDAAVTAGTAKKADVTAVNTNTAIATTGLAAGAYKVVTVDAAGNVSAKSAGTITLVDAPVVTDGITITSAEAVAQNILAPITGDYVYTVTGNVADESVKEVTIKLIETDAKTTTATVTVTDKKFTYSLNASELETVYLYKKVQVSYGDVAPVEKVFTKK